MSRQPLRVAVLEAERALAAAGVASPRVDAELLAAHVLGVERTRLPLVPLVDTEVVEALRRLVEQRARRVPLQHLLGTAVLGRVTLAVGPGVFTPRPETELLLEWGLRALDGVTAPVVVDLCTGSGALALAFAHERPDAVVHAVERDPAALAWARRNADDQAARGDTPIRLHAGDVADPELLADLDGGVDLVVCNPPYVPEGTPVPPEVAEHDPHHAVFAPDEGLEVIRHVVDRAVRLLRRGGAVAIEHDDTHGESAPALLAARRALTDVVDHPDLAGRPRFVTARRS
ncbi:release factor glutamine methyltransferase [Streptoalloteichus tenebrarius]|uniref:Release factor glutamine methyltransferase n=1 Tax=Streptoalloteichus tenebrarius (strain ATCC 17920 / DSM 40477 / JCM 4838 / CBS 697.72 / NBRC 16177 / NCIMB 11028 / NRRL B-12390 / A12253. 1 / ISP 5477) TaxID=1933 RepID=A0ABT1HXP4_STRSD|nr:peptide chain release factor N(5)-glutamine methyltransferase [Streptoalloteichus tenebrarius]MCP2260288.1 release factor glutamine methyltransferase [Streptoalloteichus tenebrarius]BFF03038.1 peptide chain release factor N(5)-glutamine methyltransferase [Streptoalloteichus tenebrarius]